MKKNSIFITLVLISVLGLFALIKKTANVEQTTQNESKRQLIVTVLPQKQIVERIAGEKFSVTELIPPGFSPATYDPTIEEMKTVASAEIYFRIGHVPFEETNLAELIEANPSMLVVDTSKNNTLRELESHTHEDENHDEDSHDEHAHEDEYDHEEEAHADEHEDETEHEAGIDPHVWLSPAMVQEQATIIYESLVTQYPEYADEFSANYEVVIAELTELDQELEIALLQLKEKQCLFIIQPLDI